MQEKINKVENENLVSALDVTLARVCSSADEAVAHATFTLRVQCFVYPRCYVRVLACTYLYFGAFSSRIFV